MARRTFGLELAVNLDVPTTLNGSHSSLGVPEISPIYNSSLRLVVSG